MTPAPNKEPNPFNATEATVPIPGTKLATELNPLNTPLVILLALSSACGINLSAILNTPLAAEPIDNPDPLIKSLPKELLALAKVPAFPKNPVKPLALSAAFKAD